MAAPIEAYTNAFVNLAVNLALLSRTATFVSKNEGFRRGAK